MAKKSLDKVIEESSQYDAESQSFLASLVKTRSEIDSINGMKRTEGWKVLDKKIREELQNRIIDLIKDDLKIQTLIALLTVTDTKTQSKILEQEIEKILPEA